jgi:hypothetical protein
MKRWLYWKWQDFRILKYIIDMAIAGASRVRRLKLFIRLSRPQCSNSTTAEQGRKHTGHVVPLISTHHDDGFIYTQ